MKKNTILTMILLAAMTIFASGQLITVTNTSDSAAFGGLITAMNADVQALYTPEGDSLSLLSEIYFDGLNWGAGSQPGAINLVEIVVTPYFLLEGRMNIGYIGNESGDDNELYMSAYSDQFKTTVDIDDANIGTVTGNNYSADGYKLFDYDGNDPNSEFPINEAPASYGIGLQDQTTKAYLQFTHWNRNPSWYDSAVQTEAQRFKFWEVLNDEEQQTGEFLMAISDRDLGFDSDRDDGFFYISGDINPVPEPASIAMVAVGFLGLITVTKRRFFSKKS